MILIRGFAYRFIIHVGGSQNWNATWRNARSRHLEPRAERDRTINQTPSSPMWPDSFQFFSPFSLLFFSFLSVLLLLLLLFLGDAHRERIEKKREIFPKSEARASFREIIVLRREPSVYYHECVPTKHGASRTCAQMF